MNEKDKLEALTVQMDGLIDTIVSPFADNTIEDLTETRTNIKDIPDHFRYVKLTAYSLFFVASLLEEYYERTGVNELLREQNFTS